MINVKENGGAGVKNGQSRDNQWQQWVHNTKDGDKQNTENYKDRQHGEPMCLRRVSSLRLKMILLKLLSINFVKSNLC